MNRLHPTPLSWIGRTATVLLFAGLLLIATPTLAMVAALSIPDLIARAEIIVLAEVQKAEVVSTEGKLQTIRQTVKPLEFLKGKIEPALSISLATLEFAGDRQRAPWHHPPAFPAIGRRVLLFLQADPLGEVAPWLLADDFYGCWVMGKDRFEDPAYPDLATLKTLISKP